MSPDWISRLPSACRIAILSILFSGEVFASKDGLPSDSSADNLAGYVAAGIGFTANQSLHQTAAQSGSPSVSKPSLDSTGSGSAYASQCYSALSDWAKSSQSYGSSHQITTTYTTTTSYPKGEGFYVSTDLRTVSASSVTTLCDGHPRAIGFAEHVQFTTSIYPTTQKVVDQVPGPFTTPPPCSIDPTDCAALWTSFKQRTSSELLTKNETLLEPPCATAANQTSYSFKEDTCAVTLAQVYAQEARLYYWPVRTINGTENFCRPDRDWKDYTPTTIPGTRTGEGPNVFISGDLTITSPMVAISLSSLTRDDGCGPTVDHTILTVPPEQVLSVRGARAAFDQMPFNYADLNWMCPSPNGTYTVQDTEGENCYQNVPAAAYWGAYPSYDQFHAYPTEVEKSLTIINDYHPYVQPPSELSAMLTSVWGTGVVWHIDGVWDPPIALSQAKVAAGATLPADGAGPTTLASPSDASPTPAAPASAITVPSVPTAAPESSSPLLPAQSDTFPQSSAAAMPEQYPDSQNGQPNPSHASNVGHSPAPASSPDPPTDKTSPQDVNGAAVHSVTLAEGSQVLPVKPMGTSAYQVGTHILVIGGPAQTIDAQVVSAAAGGLVVGSGDASATTIPVPNDETGLESAGVVTAGDQAFTRSQISNGGGEALQNSQTTIRLEVGQPAATLGSEVVSAASNGLTTISERTSSGSQAATTAASPSSGSDGVASSDASASEQMSNAGAAARATKMLVFIISASIAALIV